MSISIANAASALSEADIAAVEQQLRIKFPDEYREFLLRHNGGVPSPARFSLSERAAEAGMEWGEVIRFYSVGDRTDLVDTYNITREVGLPTSLVPIADVDDQLNGGMLCISVAGKDCGRVYYRPEVEAGDDTVYGIAKSFDAFLRRLGRGPQLPAWVMAVKGGDRDSLCRWLDGGGDLREMYKGRTPLELAAGRGNLELVQILAKRGAPLGYAYLHAFDAGRAEVMRWFFEQKLAPKAGHADLMTRNSAIWKDLDLVCTLIDAGADINCRSGVGDTPLHLAAQYAPPETVRYLIDRGAVVESFNNQGQSPLHRAVLCEDERDMIANMKVLIDAGLDLHERRRPGGFSIQPAQSAAEFLVNWRKGNGLAELEAYVAQRDKG
jgi:ankyrin repeat protein